MRYGKLIVLPGELKKAIKRKVYVLVQCDCGTTKFIREDSLKSGKTTSCGCYSRIQTSKRFLKHNQSGSREYQTWEAIKQRCLNPKHKQYPKYGGKGITVCKRWLRFENFLEDIGLRPITSGYWGIDRIDNSKGYYKKNCRWVLAKDQILNRKVTKWITYKGKTQCISDWARELKVPRARLSYRLNQGWLVELAFTLKSNIRYKKFCTNEQFT